METNQLPIDGASHDLEQAAETLAHLDARQRILWAVETFGDQVFLLSSMQNTAIVLMHMFHELALLNEVLFVDTGYHFFDTLRMRDLTMRQWRLNLVTLYPDLTLEKQEALYGKKLFTYVEGQPECCRLRKEQPLLNYLATKRSPMLVNGLRREEGGRRANLAAISPDPRTQGYQLSPLFDWRSEDIKAYTSQHGLPGHPLYAKDYASIGCYPCTTPIRLGEDPRAGRWRHLREPESVETPQYCGINFSDGSGI
jgi:phosphoadenosine phosphosulfate reductase